MTIASGTCGTNVTWRLEDDGTFYVEGTGDMDDYTAQSGQPWYSNRSSIARVLIADGITHVGAYAFFGNGSSNNMSSTTTAVPTYIRIPDSVVSIGKSGLASSNFSVIDVGAGVDELGDYCLQGNMFVIFRGGQPTTIGANVIISNNRVISDGWANTTVFTNVSSTYDYIFRTFSLGDDVTWSIDLDTSTVTLTGTGEAEDFTPTNCFFKILYKNVQYVDIDDRITGIGAYTFYDCGLGLTDIRNGRGLKKIGEYAFYKCTKMNLSDQWDLTSIGDYAFYQCTALTKIICPNVVSVGDSAFYGCTALVEANLENVETIGASAFYGCTLLESTNATKLTTVGDSAFYNCQVLNIDLYTVVTVGANAFYQCYGIKNLDLSNATSIGDSAFYNCRIAKNLILNESLTAISTKAFALCSKIIGVRIPDSVKTIGELAFNGCSALNGVIFGTGLTSIGKNAFTSCYNLGYIEFLGSRPSLGTTCFQNTMDYMLCVTSGWGSMTLFKYVALASNGTAYTNWRFKTDHSIGIDVIWSIDPITMTITLSGTGATYDYEKDDTNSMKYFFDYIRFIKIVVGEGITRVGNYLFYFSRSSTYAICRSLSLPSTLKEVGQYSFYNAVHKGYSVELPEGLEIIDQYAFSGNPFSTITIPSTVKTLNTKAFDEMASGSVTIFRGILTTGGSVPSKYKFCALLDDDGSMASTSTLNNYYPVMVKVRGGWRVIDNMVE